MDVDEILASYVEKLEEQNKQLTNENQELKNRKTKQFYLFEKGWAYKWAEIFWAYFMVIGLVWVPSFCIWNGINYKDTGKFYAQSKIIYVGSSQHNGICVYHEFDWAGDEEIECNTDKDFDWADRKIKEHREKWLELRKINGENDD